MGMAVAVALPHRDDAHLGQDGVQKDVAGAGLAAVVAHLQHVHIQRRARGHQVVLGVLLHVPGQQKAGLAVVDAQHQGGVVGVVILGHRAQQPDGGAAQLPGGTHGGHLQRQALLLGIVDKVLKALGVGAGDGRIGVPRRERGHHRRQAAHMVLVGVAAKDVFQPGDALALQVGDHQAAVLHVAAVIQHTLPVAGDEDAEGLPHVDKVHRKAAAVGRLDRLGRTCGGRLGQRAQRILAGGQPQSQGGGQGQSGDAAEQRRGQRTFLVAAVFFHLFLFPFFLLLGLVRGAKRAPGWTV